ncbi:hypothetical protein Msub_12625 [Marinobacter subterrani]|uniref:Uncharacterized protein n=1 Tax=Marinobacter subterrani TaxID=1658765 RepID=A0A0J7JE45_9GAMM|nr:hypothetical protein Msub_12625 [Marinobacter subterrani]
MKCLWVVAFLSVFPGSALGGAPSAESLLEGDGGHPVVGQQPRPFHHTYRNRILDLEAWMVRQV